jgi:uncharacterized YceG family protein
LARGNRSEAGRERTEAERERAREERARRRAGQQADTAAPGQHPEPGLAPGPPSEPPALGADPPDPAPVGNPVIPPDPATPPDHAIPPDPVTPPDHAIPPDPVTTADADHATPIPARLAHAADPALPADATELATTAHAAEPAGAADLADPVTTADMADLAGAADLASAGEAADLATRAHAVDPAGRPGDRPRRATRAARRRGSALPPLPPRPGAPGARSPSGGRRAFARAGALLGLVAVAVALWLLVRPLVHGKHRAAIAAPVSIKVVIPEGETRLQIAQIAAADGLRGSYRAASRHSSLLDPTDYGAPSDTRDLEGFLFPDTFDIDRGAPVSQLVEAQLTDFRSRFGTSQIDAARALHVTPYALLTVASMVEREAEIPKDRPLIAAVIYNRLSDGMPLGIDATIYYAYELATGTPTYTKELTESQLHINSPYNTRLHTGLPPTPISNPGLASIEAAAHPAHVPYLYYVAGADGCGEQVFSTTEAQFDVDAAAYREAVARNGGHPPVCRKK